MSSRKIFSFSPQRPRESPASEIDLQPWLLQDPQTSVTAPQTAQERRVASATPPAGGSRDPTASSSSSSLANRVLKRIRRSRPDKKTIIGATKLFLQSAAVALKVAPIPNLDQIPNTLLAWIQICETVSGNAEDLKQLCDVIKQVGDSVLQPLQEWTGEVPSELENLIQHFHAALQKQVEDIESVQRQHLLRRTIQATDVTRQISAMKNTLNDAINRFQLRMSTLILLRTERLSVQTELARLQRAPAEHIYVKTKSECVESTQTKIRASLLNHLKQAENRFVWLRGSPGTGKTAISRSIASTLESEGTLAVSFFWDKNQQGTGLDSIQLFPSTLAHQLADFNEDFKMSLVKRLRKSSLALPQNLPPETQMKALVVEPMNDLRDILSPSEGRFVIVLDGLDECGDAMSLKELMKLVLMLDTLPPFISTWSDAEAHGSRIPHEDVDRIDEDEKFRTINLMVDDGLKDVIRKSNWKPTPEDLDKFTHGCLKLPVMASIRIRDVCVQVEHGSSLRSEFEYFRDLKNAPDDVNQEYLRILRRAYITDSSGIRPHVAKNYHYIVGTIVAAHDSLSVCCMSQLLQIDEDEVYETLRPISSMVNLPSDNTESVKFFHATAKEFIRGKPVGNESDRIFFISDVRGHFLGLRLLRLVDDIIKRNELNFPTDLPLGNKKKWETVRTEQPQHVTYAFANLFSHLDPSQFLSQEPNELKKEFNRFLSQNLLSFMAFACLGNDLVLMDFGGIPELCGQVGKLLGMVGTGNPSRLYRILPFIPSSLQLFQPYRHLSDPVQVFTISGKCSHLFIPLSEDALKEVKLDELRKAELEKWKMGAFGSRSMEIFQEARFLECDDRNRIVASAALSSDGRYIALGFGSGRIEVADIDRQSTISQFHCHPPNPPAWIEFISSEHRMATEDNEGNITIFGRDEPPMKLGTLRTDIYPPLTALSDDGSCIVRVLQDHDWYDHIAILHVSGDPSIHSLESPSKRSLEVKHSSNHHYRPGIWFSPGGKFVGTYDHSRAFVWSTESHELIGHYDIEYFKTHIHVFLPHSHHIPTPEFPQSTRHLGVGSIDPVQYSAEGKGDWGEFWRKCPIYDLLCCMGMINQDSEAHPITVFGVSSALGRFPLFHHSIDGTDGKVYRSDVFFDGKVELVLPTEYSPVLLYPIPISTTRTWYGDRVVEDPEAQYPRLYRPRASKDGTRFLVQGGAESPILVDISKIV